MTGTIVATVEMMFCVFIVFLLLWLKFDYSPRKKKSREYQMEFDQREKERRQRKLEWNQRVCHAKRHLVGAKDWRDPHGKNEFVRELFGDKVPGYLWYEFNGLTADETAEVLKIFWPPGRPSFGDLEGHRNLRIRNAKVFVPEIQLNVGKTLALDQIGHVQYWETIDEDGFPDGAVLFSLKGFYENMPMPV